MRELSPKQIADIRGSREVGSKGYRDIPALKAAIEAEFNRQLASRVTIRRDNKNDSSWLMQSVLIKLEAMWKRDRVSVTSEIVQAFVVNAIPTDSSEIEAK